MVLGVLFETDSGKWFNQGKWISDQKKADIFKPSELLEIIQNNDLNWLIKKGTLQYHLVNM